MKEKIKDIIIKAKKLRESGISDLEIAKFVHIELGKLIIYDNNYSTGNIGFDLDKNLEGAISNESKRRQEELLRRKTNIEMPEQICKGMAEIYSAIMNEIGIETNVVGVLSKEEVDGEIRDSDGTTINVPEIYQSRFDSKMSIINGDNERDIKGKALHYYCQIETEDGEYIQDFLTEMSLARIKAGEAEQNGQVPGFHLKSEHKERTLNKNIELSRDYITTILNEYNKFIETSNSSDVAFDFAFKKLNENIGQLGFEEAKGFIYMISKIIKVQKPEYINFIKEDENTAEVITVYSHNGKKYFMRSGFSDIEIPVGEISDEDITKIIQAGFVPRQLKDAQKLNALFQSQQVSCQDLGRETIQMQEDTAYIDETCGEIINQERAMNVEEIHTGDKND